MGSLRAERQNFASNDTVIFAISTDPADLQCRFASELGVDFRFLPDTAHNLSVLYNGADSAGQLTLRQSVLIDRNGVVRIIDRDINMISHGKDILAKMRETGIISEQETPSEKPPAQD